MVSKIKELIKRNIIEPCSISAVLDIVNRETLLKEVWDDSFKAFPNFSEHFTVPVDNKEIEQRIRLLVVAEVAFLRRTIEALLKVTDRCSYADIGDSDGSVQLLLQKYFNLGQLTSVGINLQQQAVDKIRIKGLNAICEDAASLKHRGIGYDVISVFETLEHLSDPIGFLKGLTSIVNKNLLISVPYIRKSKVSLNYLTKKWPRGKKPTIENTHIFELSPTDWTKIFLHAGWQVDHDQKLMMFPPDRVSRLILQPYWRYESFEGFWFVSLSPSEKFSSQYVVE